MVYNVTHMDGEPDETVADVDLPRRNPLRLRTIALGMVLGTIVGVGAAVVTLSLMLHGERLPQVTFETLNAAGERWAKNGPLNYDLDLELAGVNPGVAH